MATGKNYDISVNFCDIEMPYPWMNASGPLGTPPEYGRFAGYLTGAVMSKTTSRREMKGHRPNVVNHNGVYLVENAIGLSNMGVDALSEEMTGNYPLPNGKAFILSVKPEATPEETQEIIYRMGDKFDAGELNISCPNVPGGMAIGCNPKQTEEYTEAVKKACGDKPLIVKQTPNTHLIGDVAQAAVNGGADGLTLINTVAGLDFDYRTGKPVITNKTFGISGPAILPIGLKCVNEAYQRVGDQAFIFGCGGIGTPEEDGTQAAKDIIKYIRAGADAVQICTSLFWRRPMEIDDPGILSVKNYLFSLEREFNKVIDELGIDSLKELKGRFGFDG